jgi:hypothetical protein
MFMEITPEVSEVYIMPLSGVLILELETVGMQ